MAGQTPKLSQPAAPGDASQKMLTLLAVAGFSGVITTRLCDAMLPALVQARTGGVLLALGYAMLVWMPH